MSSGTNRRQFFSELFRETAAAMRDVSDSLRTALEPDAMTEDSWYEQAPLQATPSARALSVDDLLALCDEVGLSTRSTPVRQLARLSVRLTQAKAQQELQLRSRLGGTPDLPAQFEWPRWDGSDLGFLAQVDLAEVAALDPTAPVPAHGLLLFFYDLVSRPSGLEPDHSGSCRVLHVPEDLAQLEAPEADRAGFGFNEYPLQLSPELMLPRSWSPAAEALDLDQDETLAWDELREKLASAQGVELEELTPHWQSLHRLFGYPEELGTGIELDCQLASSGISVEASVDLPDSRREELEAGAREWRLLLQLSDDDDLGISWKDGFGRLSIWMREQDLRATAFDRAWAIVR